MSRSIAMLFTLTALQQHFHGKAKASALGRLVGL
jgi:hypothetical protein